MPTPKFDITQQKKNEVIFDFLNTHENSSVVLSKKHNLKPHRINIILNEYFKNKKSS